MRLKIAVLVLVLLISEVAARDLTLASTDTKEVEVVEEANEAKYSGSYPGRGGNYGAGYLSRRLYQPAGCPYGCCGYDPWGYLGCICCSDANEAVAAQTPKAQTEKKTHN